MTDKWLCINCKHYYTESRFEGALGIRKTDMLCDALKGQPHPILGGDITAVDACLMRATLCGWRDPKLFERKP